MLETDFGQRMLAGGQPTGENEEAFDVALTRAEFVLACDAQNVTAVSFAMDVCSTVIKVADGGKMNWLAAVNCFRRPLRHVLRMGKGALDGSAERNLISPRDFERIEPAWI